MPFVSISKRVFSRSFNIDIIFDNLVSCSSIVFPSFSCFEINASRDAELLWQILIIFASASDSLEAWDVLKLGLCAILDVDWGVGYWCTTTLGKGVVDTSVVDGVVDGVADDVVDGVVDASPV